jgi:hypothetical protein
MDSDLTIPPQVIRPMLDKSHVRCGMLSYCRHLSTTSVVTEMSDYELWCVVEGDNNIFPATTPSNTSIAGFE